jgi:hypothetical protein
MVSSDWPSISINPGATTRPAASIVCRAGQEVFGASSGQRTPMAAMRPSRTPTSPVYQGEPVPSTTCPLRMIRSKVAASGRTCGPGVRRIGVPPCPVAEEVCGDAAHIPQRDNTSRQVVRWVFMAHRFYASCSNNLALQSGHGRKGAAWRAHEAADGKKGAASSAPT